MTITKEMTMGEILTKDIGIARVLMMCGMHCIGCPSSVGESLEAACAVHGIPVDEVMEAIDAYLKAKDETEA